jgi:hypothetical protein
VHLREPTDPEIADLVADAGPEPGVTHEGERYDLVQTQIRYNHLAVVGRARAGSVARLRMDSMTQRTFKIDGQDHAGPEWLIEAMTTQARADFEGETVEVMIEGMDRALVLPREMVDQMLAVIGAGAPAEPSAEIVEEPAMEAEDAGMPGEIEDQNPPEDENPMKMDAARVEAAVSAALAKLLPTALRPLTKKAQDSMRDRTDLERRAAPVLGEAFEWSRQDNAGVALAVLEKVGDSRLGHAKELADRARKGDGFAAGSLQTLMDVALDRHRDSLDSTADLGAVMFGHTPEQKTDGAGDRPSWVVSTERLNDTARGRKTA